jgi:hypothetical protein
MIYDATKLSRSSDEATIELFVEVLKGEEKNDARRSSLLERAINVLVKRSKQKDDSQ